MDSSNRTGGGRPLSFDYITLPATTVHYIGDWFFFSTLANTHRHCAGVISFCPIRFNGIWLHEKSFLHLARKCFCIKCLLSFNIVQTITGESNRGATTTRNTVCVVCCVLCVCWWRTCPFHSILPTFSAVNYYPRISFPSVQCANPLFSRQKFSHDSTRS